jgi:hypothetical protein
MQYLASVSQSLLWWAQNLKPGKSQESPKVIWTQASETSVQTNKVGGIKNQIVQHMEREQVPGYQSQAKKT